MTNPQDYPPKQRWRMYAESFVVSVTMAVAKGIGFGSGILLALWIFVTFIKR